MTRIEIPDIGERHELLELVRRTAVDGFEQEADVIAQVVAAQHLTDEPPGGVVEDRHPLRARAPCTARELVDLIAGLAAEQPGELAVSPLDQVDARCVARSATRKVWLRFDSPTRNLGGRMLT